MPVLATFFSVRRGRDSFFKFFMRTSSRARSRYEEKYGIRFWVVQRRYGWDYDNVISSSSRLRHDRQLESDEASPPWVTGRRVDVRAPHAMFLRERMGPDLKYFGIETLTKGTADGGACPSCGPPPSRQGDAAMDMNAPTSSVTRSRAALERSTSSPAPRAA